MSEIKEFLKQLEATRERLKAELSSIEEQLDQIETTMSVLKDFPTGNMHKTPDNGRVIATRKVTKAFAQMQLKPAMRIVLEESGKPMSAPEIRDALLARGYRTKSKKFRAQVYNVLTKEPRFINNSGMWSLADK